MPETARRETGGGGATVVFVDALARVYLDAYHRELAFLDALPGRAEVEPGMGFSINIKAELLAGLTPDDLGFFCKWNRRPTPAFRVPRWVKHLGRLFDGGQLTSRLAHRVFSRVVGVDLFTIPFGEIDLFEPVLMPEAYAEGFPHPTILSRGGFRRVVHGPGLRTDAQVAAAAERALDSGDNVYVALIEPDAVGHRQGPQSAAMRAKLQEVGAHLEALWAAHRRAGRGTFLVFSDHGMAPVTSRPWFDPEEAFGPPGPGRYACFSDSTMLRVWVEDPRRREEFEGRLGSLPWGALLSADERVRFGITSPAHGDFIVLAHEGVIPVPSHVGGKHPRAVGMHGYHPDLESQRGVVAWWSPGDAGTAPERIRARDLPVLWAAVERAERGVEGDAVGAGAGGGRDSGSLDPGETEADEPDGPEAS